PRPMPDPPPSRPAVEAVPAPAPDDEPPPWIEREEEGAEAPAPVAEGHFGHTDWLACFDSLGLGGLTRNLAAHCVVEADDGERLTLRLDPSQEAMQAEVHVTRIREALAAIGIERRLILSPGPLPSEVETPKQQADRLAGQRHSEAIEALNRDPHVQRLQQAFGARLIESTVKSTVGQVRG
ncbi:DNA polymerase III subunit gamma/tau C-terminal domain-containing protein, partial [Halomonas lysinitropha]